MLLAGTAASTFCVVWSQLSQHHQLHFVKLRRHICNSWPQCWFVFM